MTPLKLEQHSVRDGEVISVREYRGQDFKIHSEETFTFIRQREAFRGKLAGYQNLLAVLPCSETELNSPSGKNFVDRLAGLSRCIRATDSIGWLIEDHLAGVLFTGIETHLIETAEGALLKRLEAAGFSNTDAIQFEWIEDPNDQIRFPASPLTGDELISCVALEQRRSERSGRPFLLATIDGSSADLALSPNELLRRFTSEFAGWRSPLDDIGWLEHSGKILLIIAELDLTGRDVVDLEDALAAAAKRSGLNPASLVLDIYPYSHSTVLEPSRGSKLEKAAKRTLDILGSLGGLIVLSPLLIAIALAVKATSPGPVLFRQQRTGRRCKEFTFFKFRSMHVNSDAGEHRKFVESLIAGEKPADGEYKLKNDTRITPIGAFLRRTSLDELPQLLNVLRGDMSLVGPRPPIPYEVQQYSFWHRRRLFAAQPGITGLWQVEGRSRVCFDEMVRLDLQYAASWSIWLDIRILLRTPKAVVSGNGAR